VRKLAAAVLLAGHWREGCRHELALAVSGGLLLADWAAEGMEQFLLCGKPIDGLGENWGIFSHGKNQRATDCDPYGLWLLV
jgi:hypothetical protein